MSRRRVTVVASDGKRESISWYDGAAEVSVIRCARVALGLPVFGTAHLVWKSGDIVDFGKPIDDGVTLFLDAVVQDDDSATFTETSSIRGIFKPNRRRLLSAPPHPPVTQSYASPADYSPPSSRRREGISANGLLSLFEAARNMLSSGSLTTRQRAGSAWGASSTEKASWTASEEERLPLLRAALVPAQSTDFAKDEEANESHQTLRTTLSANDHDDSNSSPTQQRGSILKLKRILAHLANERTYLAWVRVAAKLFSTGALSLTLAAKASGGYSVSFALLGLMYFALCPYLVFVGLKRFHNAADVMQGTVHDAYAYFTGNDLKAMTALMLALAFLTVAIMVDQLLARY